MFCANHAEVSEAAIRTWGYSHGRDETWQSWSQVAGVHHGKRTQSAAQEPCFPYGGQSWSAERSKLLEVLIEAFGPLPEKSPTPESLWLAAGLTTVADWIGSNENWFPAEGLPQTADHGACARYALEDAGFAIPEVRRGCSFEDLFPAISSPNEMQAVVHELADRPGLFILEAPMGTGKTEAALYAAYRLMAAGHHHGVYFALPTRLTSNRLRSRLAAFIDQAFGVGAGARLVHGQAWLADQYPGGEELRPGGAWFAPIKRALLYPFGVGTIDQALLAVMNVKHGFVRAFGLAGKVVILDEVHSYDAYTGTLIKHLVDCLLRLECTVMILSATLTREKRNEFFSGADRHGKAEAYPLITHQSGNEVTTRTTPPPASRRVECRYVPDSLITLADQAADLADSGQCALWICNTVARSQRAFGLVKSTVREGIEVGLLHSRFPPWRRDELETLWLSRLGKEGDRPSGCVLVATQVVEQSVDIDGDMLITDLAPTDMLLQRMGRLWRHPREGRTGRATCLIAGNRLSSARDQRELKELVGSSGYVYAPYVLWRSYTVWQDRPEVLLPDEIRTLLEATYCQSGTTEPPWVRDLYDHLAEKKCRLGQLAMAMTRDDLPTRSDDEDAALTRYDDRSMVKVLLVRDCDQMDSSRARLELASGETVELVWEAGARRDVAAARQVHGNLVTLPKYPDFENANERSTPRWLRSTVYGPVVVLKINSQGFLENLDGQGTRYGYKDDRGVWRREDAAVEPAEDMWEGDFNESDW